MDHNNRGDIRINGSGSAGGGTYNSVVVKGSGRIGGDLKCEVFSIGGTGTVEYKNSFVKSGDARVGTEAKV